MGGAALPPHQFFSFSELALELDPGQEWVAQLHGPLVLLPQIRAFSKVMLALSNFWGSHLPHWWESLVGRQEEKHDLFLMWAWTH